MKIIRILLALLALVITSVAFTARAAEVKLPDTNLLFVVSDRLAKATIESEPTHRWDYFRKSVEVLLGMDLDRNQVLDLEKSVNNVFSAIGRGIERRPNTVEFFQGKDMEEVRTFLTTAEAALKLKTRIANK